MPRFYFDIFNGRELVPDMVGDELSGLDAARQEGVATAMELWSGVLRSGQDPRSYAVQICDAARVLQLIIGFDETLDSLAA